MYLEKGCGTGVECGTNLSTFEMLYPSNPNSCLSFGNCSDLTPRTTQWVVRVAPAAGSGPVCATYTVRASNI